MANYKALFIVDGSQSFTVRVVVDLDTGTFYTAGFDERNTGGFYYSELNNTGRPLTIDEVRELARTSGTVSAERYRDITEENWRELIR